MLELKKVSKEFHDVREGDVVIDNVSFKVKKGDFVSIIGPSGCGKTVLLKIIAGLEKVKGKVIAEKSINPVIVWQDYRLFPWRTAYQNVMLPLEEKKIPEKIMKKKVDGLLRFIELYEFRNYYAHQLSGGMQQRIALARALIAEPKLLLLDEPFSNLEWRRTQEFYKELKRIQKEKNLTLIQVTHDIPNALKYSNKIIIMSNRPARVKAILNDIKNNKKTQGRILKLLEL